MTDDDAFWAREVPILRHKADRRAWREARIEAWLTEGEAEMFEDERDLNEKRRNFWSKQVDVVVGPRPDMPSTPEDLRTYYLQRDIAHAVLPQDRNTGTERRILRKIVEDDAFWTRLEAVRDRLNP